MGDESMSVASRCPSLRCYDFDGLLVHAAKLIGPHVVNRYHLLCEQETSLMYGL